MPRKAAPGKKSIIDDRMMRFVDEYLIDLDAPRAWHAAGHPPSRSAPYAALQNPEVRAIIEAKQKQLAAKMEITRERVLREIAHSAFLDPTGIFDEDSTIKKPSEWSEQIRRSIASIEVFEEFQGNGAQRRFIGITKKVKFASKLDALEKLAKHLGLYEAQSREPNKLDHLSPEEVRALEAVLLKITQS